MADQAINALPIKTAPTTGDKMLMIGAAEEYQIDYDQLATAILNKLTSKTFTLDQGTKSLVAALNELNSKTVFADNAGFHNSVYRGKYLGTSVTAAQYSAISSGKFTDLYIGDYWTINGVNYRIAAFDYYYNCGDTSCNKHHAVIVPDSSFYNHVMNDTNTTSGAYIGSKMYIEGLSQAKTTIKTAFSGHVISKRIYLSNATSNGKASDGTWFDSEVDLMCEHMVYGSGVFSPVSDGTIVPSNYRVEKSQLPLFQHEPSRIGVRVTWWMRDVISDSYFALVGGSGNSNYTYASNTHGVRPAFCIS